MWTRFLYRAKGILGDMGSLSDEMSALPNRIEGPLHVIAPFGFGHHIAGWAN